MKGMKKMKSYLCLMAVLYAPIGLAGFDPVTYWNYLQDLRTAENSAMQVQSQLKALQYEARNAKNINQYQWQSILNLVQRMDSVSREGQALSYSASNMDAAFRKKYPNYASSEYGKTDYQKAYKEWNATTLDTVRGSMRSLNASAQHYQSEQNLLAQLKQQGATAQGRMQALQVASEISVENVNQLQELKRISMAQANSQNAYIAYQVSKESYKENSMQQIVNNIDTRFPAYRNNPNFGLIKAQK